MAVLLVAGQLSASAAGTAQSSVPSAVPAANTPNIVDGTDSSGNSYRVFDIQQVGGLIVVAGSFTQVQNAAANGGNTLARTDVFAFDPGTGAVSTTFAPTLNGPVNAVAAGPNGTVFLGGVFSQVNGRNVRNLARVNLSDGALTSGFTTPALNGAVNDVEVSGNRLFLAGVFTTVANAAHGGLATVNATTGALDPYLGLNAAGHHNYPFNGTAQAPVGVSKIDISPDGTQMVAIGNFTSLAGQSRNQVAKVLLQPTSAVVDPNWATQGYVPACSANAFDSYIRGVQWSPDGSYFVITATGGPHPGTLCDAVARFDLSVTGSSVQPSWVDRTGGDTLWTPAVTGTAVYVGGHQRWMNNPMGSDHAAAGAVPRPGLAALDPLSGVPLTWNPGRNPRGIGAQALLATTTGLYVGSDTDWIGNRKYKRQKIAYFPLAGGTAPVSQDTGSLPGNVYLAGGLPSQPGSPDAVVTRTYDGNGTVGTDTAAPGGGVAWSRARGAFMAGNTLYYGYPDASGTYELARQTFNGASYGTQQILSTPYKDPTWDGVSTGSFSTTYDGVFPNFYGSQLSSVAGMFYASGRLYYALVGSSGLYYRNFSVDSGIVSGDSFTAVPSGFSSAGGMFVSGGYLYVADRGSGNLSRRTFANGVLGTTATVVSGPTKDGHDWRADAVFIGPGAAPQSPIAVRGATGASSASVTTTLAVPVPAGVRAGDGLVLVVSVSSGATATAPGFTRVAAQTAMSGTATAMTTLVLQRVADGTEGRAVTVKLSAGAKATGQLVAYSGTAATGPVRRVQGASDAATATHVTPTAAVNARDWVLSVWSDKNTATRTWTPPSGVVTRSNVPAGSTGGEISTLLADSGAGVPAGSYGRLPATVSVASPKATELTVVIAAP